MYRPVLKSIVLTSFAVLAAIPAFSQVRADLGPLHIRIATDAPPRVRFETRTTRPYRDAVWINGYWDRQDDQWAWSSGRWERPSDRRNRWIKPRYRREGRAWRYEPGRWSDRQLVEGEDYRRYREDNRSDRDRRRN
jgi:WXXGXW repeat (2 copies)